MEQAFSRTELLLGSSALERLAASRVAVFGIGGVGGYVCEALARTGVGHLDLIDSDTVAVSNINRQIIATTKTVGQYKTDAMEARILDINPAAKITKHNCFFLPETAADFPFNQYDYVVDAVDTMSAKLALVTHCHAAGVPIICAMGAGNKLDPTGFQVADLAKTKMDPLARVMRRELKKRGIHHLKVVYSEEMPIRPMEDMAISCRAHCVCPPGTARKCTQRRDIPGSTPFRVSAGIDTASDGCAAFPANTFAGAIALVRRGTCSFAIKVNNAAAAGAVGVVIANNAAGVILPSVPGTTIPTFSVLQADGNTLRDWGQANPATATAGSHSSTRRLPSLR